MLQRTADTPLTMILGGGAAVPKSNLDQLLPTSGGRQSAWSIRSRMASATWPGNDSGNQ